MMSGPAPVLAATAAFGRTSSQPSLSPCTKRLQRRTRKVAPFSGLRASDCARASGANRAVPVPMPATAAALAEPSRNLRRLKGVSFIGRSPVFGCVSSSKESQALGGEALAAASVEEMRTLEVGHQVNGAAGREVVALAKDRSDLGAAVTTRDQRV